MADEADRASMDAEVLEQAAVLQIRKNAVIDPGYAGECDRCGEMMPRLIKGVCCPCRDKYGLK